jgi:hypothetical protein
MKVYLNKAFLINFLLKESEDDILHDIKRFITSVKSGAEIVIVDVDEEEAYQNPELSPYFRKLGNKLPLFDKSILGDCQSPDFHNHSKAHLFFLDDQAASKLEEFGCFVTNSSNLDNVEWLFQDMDIRMDETQKDWSILKKIKHPCNALIITDNYLLSKETGYENVISILESLMPESLNNDFLFHITIIGYDARNCQRIEAEHARLTSHFQNRYPYEINLTIIREDHHDRCIFTNYYRIVSPKGFGLFKAKRISKDDETTIAGKPVTHFGSFSTTESNIKKELAKCQRISRTERMPDRFAGNKINRLLN